MGQQALQFHLFVEVLGEYFSAVLVALADKLPRYCIASRWSRYQMANHHLSFSF